MIKKNEALHELARRKAVKNFYSFCLMYDYNFFDGRDYLEEVAIVLEKAYKKYKENNNKIIRIGISLAPNAGKSYIVTLFCAWCLGNDINERILRTSHTRDLVVDHSRDVKNILGSDKFNDIFRTNYVMGKSAEGKWGLVGSKYDVNFNVGSVSSGIQGKRASIAIIDDSIAKAEDALSELFMINLIERFYKTDFSSRIVSNALEIIVNTRWREADIIGHLKELEYLDYEIKIPALVNNKSFCENVISTNELLKKEKDPMFQAMYQQEPLDYSDLLLLREEELNWFTNSQVERDKHGNIKSNMRIARLDLADKGTDRVALIFADIIFEDNKINGDTVKVIIDDNIVYTSQGYDKFRHRLINECIKQRPRYLFVESNFGGSSLAVEFRMKLEKKGIEVVELPTTKNKEVKIDLAGLAIRNKFYFRSDANTPDYKLFLQDMLRYKRMIKKQKDDGLDVMAELKDDISRLYGIFL